MKIIMYSTHEHERTAVKEWEKATGNEVKMVAEPLSMATVAQARDFDGVTTQQTASLGSAEVYERLAAFGIKQIATRTVGYDMIDLAAAKQAGLTVTNVPVYSPRAIAEMGVAQAMYLLRNIGRFNARMAKADFRWSADLMAKEIFSCTVGLIGAGHIGGATAQIYKALGARVIAADPAHDPEWEPFMEYVDLDTVLKESDIISLHAPLLPTTKGIIDAAALDKMKDSAILINMARGGLVDTQALIAALKAGKIGAAGLDTLADEATYFGHQVSPDQVPEDFQELAAMPNVVVTPHVAFFTNVAVRNMVQIALNDVVAVASGRRSKDIVQA